MLCMYSVTVGTLYTQYLSVFPQFQSDYITTCSLQQFAGLLVEREDIIAGLSLHEGGRAAVMEDHGGGAAVGEDGLWRPRLSLSTSLLLQGEREGGFHRGSTQI